MQTKGVVAHERRQYQRKARKRKAASKGLERKYVQMKRNKDRIITEKRAAFRGASSVATHGSEG